MPDALDTLTAKRPKQKPLIYAYSQPEYPGLLKIGYTTRALKERMAEHFRTKGPTGKRPYKAWELGPAMREDGSVFMDHAVHRALRRANVPNPGGEWFECSPEQARAAYLAVFKRIDNIEERDQNFAMRPEQARAVERTLAYFSSSGLPAAPKFLWNAKMRFGKTFAAYQLAKKMGLRRVLILTFKPAVQSAWREDLLRHIDFEGWQFISAAASEASLDQQYERADKERPIVCFGSFQDFLGANPETGGIKAKNEWVHRIDWDLVIFDEYHFGAWKDNAQALFAKQDEEAEADAVVSRSGNAIDESWLPITAKRFLYLSGTPFRALNSGEFIEEQIFNWTYADEQAAKAAWQGLDNPYSALPELALLTYRLPDSIREIAKEGEFDEFSLNAFFEATGRGRKATFVHKEYVQKWLDLIRGAYLPATKESLKLGKGRPAMPFSDIRLSGALSHTLWYLPEVAGCEAMGNLLREPQNKFYHDFRVSVCAGAKAGVGLEALGPVLKQMGDPLATRSITLSCGKLTTGVTVRPWGGIFMLRNLKSPESYFQTAFRAQSPWELPTEDGDRECLKEFCYVLDFAPERALRQIADYACSLDVKETNPETKVSEFVQFLPVIAFDGSTMRLIDASEILDISMSGTSATLLARRWESALLVNVDNATLTRLLDNEEAKAALAKIEGFRSLNLNKDIEFILNASDHIKKMRKRQSLSEKERKQLTEEEKKLRKTRRDVQEKLIKLAARIPIFMYLSDYREMCLEDVITKLEPNLFRKVTGLEVADFNLLRTLDLFNSALMNSAVYNFKRYEDASFSYAGIESQNATGNVVGLFDTVLTREEYEKLYRAQQESML